MRGALIAERRGVLAGLGAALVAGTTARAQLGGLLGAESGPRFDAGRKSTGPLALERGGENAVFRGLLNGTPVRVLLDSGASLSVMDLGLARRLRLRGFEAQSVRDTAGRVAGGVQLDAVSLRLPGLSFLRLRTVAVDLAPLAETGQEVPMVLGAEAFAGLAVALDRAAGSVSFSEPQAVRPPPRATALDLRADGVRTRVLPVDVEGAPGVRAQFDLGSQSPLSASLDFAQAQGWLVGRPVSTWAAASVSGVTRERITTLREIRLAGVALPPTPVELLARWDAPEAPLVVGYPLLSRFALLADYGADRLWLAPGADISAPFRRDRSGLALRPAADGRGQEVVHVAAGGPGERTGWREGEVVVGATDTAGRPLGQGWGYGPAGMVVRLRGADGQERALTLVDYF